MIKSLLKQHSMQKRLLITLLIFITAIAAGFAYRLYVADKPLTFPTNEETIRETIIVENGEVLDEENQIPKSEEETMRTKNIEEKEIYKTGDIRHSVPLEEVIGGGPPKDGIPSIDKPKFVSVEDASTWISDDEPGLAFSDGEVNRFYPFQILVWHEIVNDTVNEKDVLITYCPLCLSGIVFDPIVQGERVEFGTSGKLWNSNLVMYDRKTDSLWSQVLGEAIVGEMTGTELPVLPSDQMRFGEWKNSFPNGQVLSRDTGARRIYGYDPYGDYYTTEGVFFPLSNEDNRLQQKDFILGITHEGQAKAYYPPTIKEEGIARDTFGDKIIIAVHDKELDVVRLYEETPDGERIRINPIASFWFAWVAAHPETELYK